MTTHELVLLALGSAVVFSWTSYLMDGLKRLVTEVSEDQTDTEQTLKTLIVLFSIFGSIGLLVVGIISGLLLSLSITALLVSW